MSSACGQIRSAILCAALLSGLCSCLRHYILINEPKNWYEAQRHCREKHTDLATVENMDDVERLIAAAGSGYSGRVWIGLYDIWWSWRWSLPEDHLYGNEDHLVNWAHGEPGSERREWELCGALLQLRWRDVPCSGRWPFVCYNNTNTDLPITSTERYVFINEAKTWQEAQDFCMQHHTSLASVRTKTEDEVIQQVVPKDTLTLIGMHRHTWMWWSDGSEHIFSHWLQGHPAGNTGNCAASVVDAANSGKLVEHDCGTEFPFMCCGKNLQKMFRVKLKVLKSTTDLNDPAVTDAILSLMEQKLKEDRNAADFKVTWIKQPDNSIFYKEVNGKEATGTSVVGF